LRLKGGRRSTLRDAVPVHRQIRAIRSASSSVTMLFITRITISISLADRTAIGPPVASNHGTVPSQDSRRAIENALA
jgi:hypothetical protein